jgi:nucleoside-diphosphate-sugar epimerase
MAFAGGCDMKVVITGSSGYIGQALIERWSLRPEVSIVGIDRAPPAAGLAARFQFVQADLATPPSAWPTEMFDDIDTVVHLAAARGDWALSSADYFRDNVAATEGLLSTSWAARAQRWIFMSSVSVYGPSDAALSEDAPLRPIGAYGQSKLASEERFRQFASQHSLQWCIIRPSAVFSPGHPPNTNVYKLIESLRTFPVPLIGSGANRKTLTYLPNLLQLIDWCLAGMQDGRQAGAIYNYVEHPVQSVAELIATLRSAGVRPARTLPVPLGLALAAAWPVYQLGRLIGIDLRVTPDRVRKYSANTWYDASRVRRDGFDPAVGLEAALTATARWHLDRLT